jgi:hypothetical protein
MSALSNVHASTLLNTSLRSGTYYLALFLTDPTASGTGTEGERNGYGGIRRRIREKDYQL